MQPRRRIHVNLNHDHNDSFLGWWTVNTLTNQQILLLHNVLHNMFHQHTYTRTSWQIIIIYHLSSTLNRLTVEKTKPHNLKLKFRYAYVVTCYIFSNLNKRNQTGNLITKIILNCIENLKQKTTNITTTVVIEKTPNTMNTYKWWCNCYINMTSLTNISGRICLENRNYGRKMRVYAYSLSAVDMNLIALWTGYMDFSIWNLANPKNLNMYRSIWNVYNDQWSQRIILYELSNY